MNQYFTKAIGIKDEQRKDALLLDLGQTEELKDMLNEDFDKWSNYDCWESIRAQQWIFAGALDVYRGKKIDIKCDCCDYIDSVKVDFENINDQKCYGIKSLYMIDKVLDEIVLAKAIRDSDGTYFA